MDLFNRRNWEKSKLINSLWMFPGGLVLCIFCTHFIFARKLPYFLLDFRCYYEATPEFLAGRNPYSAEIIVPYLYPLFLLVLLSPIILLGIPVQFAGYCWITINIVCFFASVEWGIKYVGSLTQSQNNMGIIRAIVYIGLIFFHLNFAFNIRFGQINYIVAFAVTRYFTLANKESPNKAVIWLAAAGALKMVPLVLIIHLYFRFGLKTIPKLILWTVLFCGCPFFWNPPLVIESYSSLVQVYTGADSSMYVNGGVFFSLPGLLSFISPSGTFPLTLIFALGLLGLPAIIVLGLEWSCKKHQLLLSPVLRDATYLILILLVTPLGQLHHLIYYILAFSLTVGWVWTVKKKFPHTSRLLTISLILSLTLYLLNFPMDHLGNFLALWTLFGTLLCGSGIQAKKR